MGNERKQARGSLLARHKLLIEALKDPETTKGDCQVLAAISEHMNHAGAAWPGIDKIAEKTGIHRSTALRGTEKLEALGYLVVDRMLGRSNFYQLADTRSRRATGTSSKDATGVGGGNGLHGCDPTSSSAATNQLQACNPTSSKDATRTQLKNSASNSIHRTQGASHVDPEDQGEATKRDYENRICSDYRKALETDQKLVRAMEETYWGILQRHGLIEEGRMPRLKV